MATERKNPPHRSDCSVDMTYDGPGLKVAEIVEGGPFGHADTAMKPGAP